MPASSDAKSVIESHYEANENEVGVDEFDALYHDDYVGHEPAPDGGGFEKISRKQAKRDFEESQSVFPDSNTTLHEIIGDGPWAAYRWTMKGTHKGRVAGILPTSREVVLVGMNMTRVEDGKIIEDWEVRDDAGMFAQLGFL